MSWQGLEGHDDVVEQFRHRLQSGRLASTFLFVGPPGVGKRAFARKLAQTLLCRQVDAAEMSPCGVCPSCVQALAGTHPDLLTVAKPDDKTEIPLSLLIGPKERRMQEGLCHAIGLRPYMAGRRIAIIEDADALNEEGANCLLKTLEEPPPMSVLILVGSSADRQLPTIRSRAQIVRFRPLPTELLRRLIVEQGIADAAAAGALAQWAEGSLDRARHLADPDLDAFRQELLTTLAAWPWDSVALARRVTAFVESAGKDAPPRRERARVVIGFAIEFFRHLARLAADMPPADDTTLAAHTEAARGRYSLPAEELADCVDRCLDALAQIERNAHLVLLLECWIDELSQLAAGRPTPAWT